MGVESLATTLALTNDRSEISQRGEERTGEANALAADAKYRARISEEEEERHIIIALYLAIKCGRPTHSTLSRRAWYAH